jgi:hypothetical protein
MKNTHPYLVISSKRNMCYLNITKQKFCLQNYFIINRHGGAKGTIPYNSVINVTIQK